MENGQLTVAGMQKLLDDFATNQRDELLSEVAKRLPALAVPAVAAPAPIAAVKRNAMGQYLYAIDGEHKWWDVAPDFAFPKKATLQHGWPLWTKGIPHSNTKPFCRFKRKHLPKKLHNTFGEWSGIFKKMEKGLSNPVPGKKRGREGEREGRGIYMCVCLCHNI